MYGEEKHKKYLDDIQKNIDEVDRSTKEKAESIIQNVSRSYRDKVLAAITNAKLMEADARRVGNQSEAERYKLAAEIYESLLVSLGL